MRHQIAKVLMAITFGLLFITPKIGLADISEATHVLNGSETYRPLDAAGVTVYLFKPNFNFKIIATIEARGMAELPASDPYDLFGMVDRALDPPKQPTEKEDLALAIKALKEEAASIGADAVIIVKNQQVRVSQNATERRIFAAAIRTSTETPNK